MSKTLVLASGSEIRQQLLRNAGVAFQVLTAPVDEDSIRAALVGEGAKPRDIADYLAEQKARRTGTKASDAMVIGCDQVLEFDGEILSKVNEKSELLAQLQRMNGRPHKLHSAAVIIDEDRPVWRHVGTVTLHMRRSSDSYLQAYVDRNWPEIAHAVGGYKLEEEGVRLFRRFDGDYFHVLGLPLLELLDYLSTRGVIPG